MFSLSYGQVINEFEPNPDGGDPTMVSFEIKGTPSASFDLWILSIESDNTTAEVDRASNVTGSFDANGLAEVMIPDLENPAFTVVLCDNFTGSIGDDLDSNDDGILETTSLGNVLDAIGIPDQETGDTLYGVQLGGADFSYTGGEPKLVFRDGATDDWFAVNADNTVYQLDATQVQVVDFDLDPTATTFAAVNPVYTAPSGPNITASGTLAAFSYDLGNGPSAEDSFTASATDLGGDLTITAPAEFELSLTSGSGFTNPLAISPDPSGAVSSTTIYVRLSAGLTIGNYSGDITLSSAGATDRTVAVTGDVTAVTNQCFDLSTGIELFELVTVTTNSQMDVWTLDMGTYSMNGFCGSGCEENVDTWLIFGPLDMTAVSNLALEFDAAENFGNTDLLVQYTSAYSGCPDGTTWTLAGTVTEADEGAVSVDLSAAMGTDVFIGIQYLDDGVDGYSDWDLSNMELVSTGTCPTLGIRPVSACAGCGLGLQTENYVCLANTTGTDAVTIEIPYTGMDNTITSVSTTSGGTIGGDDPIMTADGTITISGLSEGDAWDLTLNGGDCDGTTVSGTVPSGFCDPSLPLPLYEGFDYTVGQNLSDQVNWEGFNSGDDITIGGPGGLTYPGLAGNSQTGNHVAFDGGGAESKIEFDEVDTGSVYASFLVNVTDLSAINDTDDGGYIAALAASDSGYDVRVWVRPEVITRGGASYEVSITSLTSSTNGAPFIGSYSAGDTVLIVLSYEPGTGNIKGWVNPGTLGGAEPTPDFSETDANPVSEIDRFVLRQDSPGETPFVLFDELRIGSTYAEVTPQVLSDRNNFNLDKLSIFPNPANAGYVTIASPSSDAMNVEVFDLLGKQIKRESLTNNTLDVSGLSTGLYILRITQNNASTTRKLVIK